MPAPFGVIAQDDGLSVEHVDIPDGETEKLILTSDQNLIDTRFPVQYVIRPHTAEHRDYRGYAGQVAAGVMKPGDEVIVLPSGFTTQIASID